jgi:hypothetical protein
MRDLAKFPFWLVALALGATACAGASLDQLRARAAHDLRCDPQALSLQPIGQTMQSVNGCGQQLTYLERCDGPKDDPSTRCTWALDATSLPVEAPTRVCVPNQTQICNGPGACQGAQACLADGSGFSACDCGTASTTPPPSDELEILDGPGAEASETEPTAPAATPGVIDADAP